MSNDVDPAATRRAEEAAFGDDAVPFRALEDHGDQAPGAVADGASSAHDPAAAGRDDVAEHPHAEDDDVVVLSWWQHPVNVVSLVLAMALIGGMLGWLIADDRAAERGGPVDVGFLHDMRAHHEQAVQMAYIFRDVPDTSPALRTVAGSILVGQNIEIGRMIEMLRDMGRPEAAGTDEAMGWMGMPTTQAEMPGMATEEELQALASSRGAAADELFVSLMVAHHEAGVHMAEVAATDAELAKVRAFAGAVAAGQRSEIVELQQLVD